MSWQTHRLALIARNVGRTIGVNRWIARWMLGGGYETRYDQQLSAVIHRDDCVWDIGANVGYYTRSFAERVGTGGTVFAFEPSPANFERLKEQTATLQHATPLQCGLGETDGQVFFQQGADELGATSRVTEHASSGLLVTIRSGDSLLAEGLAYNPNVIKMDVEGFELSVLSGMPGILRLPQLRAVGIEVHFGILKERNLAQAPQQIESLLRDAGFTLNWCDSSHLLAVRAS